MQSFKSLIIGLLIFSVILVTFPQIETNAQTQTIIVPDDYSTIQEAIDNAENGYTIFVRSGTYEGPFNQTLVINKTISLIGENTNNTIINFHPLYAQSFIMGQPIGWTWRRPLVVDAKDVIISGFTFNSDGGDIWVNGNNTQISANLLTTRLYLWGSNQIFAFNTLKATATSSGSYCKVYMNRVINSSIHGGGYYNSIFQNNVTAGGIHLGGESMFELIYTNIIRDGEGIKIASVGSIITNNTITNCGSRGIEIVWGSDNLVIDNFIADFQTDLVKAPSGFNITLPEWANVEPINIIPTFNFPPEPPTEDIINVFVTEVIDGDSFITAEGYEIRLADIDAPESWEDGFRASKMNLELLLENKSVTLDIDSQTGKDEYGRYVCLAYLEHNSTHFLNINQYLVELSFAVVDDFTNNEFDPNIWNLYIHKNIIPEFSSWIIIPIFLIATVTGVVCKKKLTKA